MRARVAALAGPAAAVALLIAHRAWLQRTDLRTRFTFTGTDHDTEITSAGIDGAAAITVLARALACSGSEAGLLRIAARLAKGDPGRPARHLDGARSLRHRPRRPSRHPRHRTQKLKGAYGAMVTSVQFTVLCHTRRAARRGGRSDSGVMLGRPFVCGCARRWRRAGAHVRRARAPGTATTSEGGRQSRPR
jgi:hypothetical protein